MRGRSKLSIPQCLLIPLKPNRLGAMATACLPLTNGPLRVAPWCQKGWSVSPILKIRWLMVRLMVDVCRIGRVQPRLPRHAGATSPPGTRNLDEFGVLFQMFILKLGRCSTKFEFGTFFHLLIIIQQPFALHSCRRLALLLWLSSRTLRCLARALFWPREMAVELKGAAGEAVVKMVESTQKRLKKRLKRVSTWINYQ